MCKFWKVNGFNKYRLDAERFSNHKRRMFALHDAETSHGDSKVS